MSFTNYIFVSLALLSLAWALVSRPDFAGQAAEVRKLQGSSIAARDAVPNRYVAAPYYPTPPGGWVASWSEAYAKAAKVVQNMTLVEKVNLTSGTGYLMGPCVGNTGSAWRFGIPNLCLQDSALGVASTDNNTAFPPGITTGATFNKALVLARGQAIGAEARGKGVNFILGPVVGPIGRKPRGGRNWEGFGADPVLQAHGGALTVKGIQENGVIATVKHFIGNEQEEYRMDAIPHGLMKAISSNIDDRTLHELYAWPFAEAIRAGVGAVMASYNDLNGSDNSQNSMLLNGILKDELGFQGAVMSDWFGQIGGVSSALAGLDMAMPGGKIIFTMSRIPITCRVTSSEAEPVIECWEQASPYTLKFISSSVIFCFNYITLTWFI
jgi:beta-glucosidase